MALKQWIKEGWHAHSLQAVLRLYLLSTVAGWFLTFVTWYIATLITKGF